jgi:hypothetical protein
MSKLFCTDFCLSGMCVCRNFTQAAIIEREVSNEKNHMFEKRRAEELLQEARRLFTETEAHKMKGEGCKT